MSNEKLPQRDEYQDGTVFGQEVLKQLDNNEDEVISHKEEIQAQVEADHEEFARNEQITSITAQLEMINRAVQQSTFLGSEFGNEFGVDFKHNKAEAQKWIEENVAKLEESLRVIQKEQIAAENAKKHAKTIEQLNKINKAVQQSTFLGSEFGNEFGVDFKHNKAEAQKWIEKKVAELEASMRPEVSASGDISSSERTNGASADTTSNVEIVGQDQQTEDTIAESQTEVVGATPIEKATAEAAAEAYMNAEMMELKRQQEGSVEASETLEKNEGNESNPDLEALKNGEKLRFLSKDGSVYEVEKTAVEGEYTLTYWDGDIASNRIVNETYLRTQLAEGWTRQETDADKYWNAEMAELKRQQEGTSTESENTITATETDADKYWNAEMAELKRQQEGKVDESAVVPAESGATNQPLEGGSVESETSSEMTPIRAEGVKVLRESHEGSAEKKSKWGWLKERLKGLATIGFWEVHQAERFRAGTKEVGKEVSTSAESLKQTRDLDIEVARAEADKIREMVQGENGEAGMTRKAIEEASRQIDSENESFNARAIEKIITQARGEVLEKLAKYKNEYGDGVLGKERLAQFEAGLKQALLESTIGMGERASNIVKKEVNFKKAIRERLDPKYWKRYVYGGVEAALWVGGYIYATYEGAAGAAKAITSMDIPMKDTIWKTSKEFLMQHGVSNPSNADIMRISKQVALDNNIGVAEWGLPGSPMDTAMGQGHLLKYKGAMALAKASINGFI